MKLFEYDIHLGGYKVLVQTRDVADNAISSQKIAPKAITLDKLADEIIQMILTSEGGTVDLTSYATKDDVRGALNGIFVRVDQLPQPGDETLHKIFLRPSENVEEENLFDEFITVVDGYSNYSWEKIGTTKINLSDYYTKEEVRHKIEDAIVDNESVFSEHHKAPSGYGVDALFARKTELKSVVKAHDEEGREIEPGYQVLILNMPYIGAGQYAFNVKEFAKIDDVKGAIKVDNGKADIVGDVSVADDSGNAGVVIEKQGIIKFRYLGGSSYISLFNPEADDLAIAIGNNVYKLIHTGNISQYENGSGGNNQNINAKNITLLNNETADSNAFIKIGYDGVNSNGINGGNAQISWLEVDKELYFTINNGDGVEGGFSIKVGNIDHEPVFSHPDRFTFDTDVYCESDFHGYGFQNISDERRKNVLGDIDLSIESIADAPLIKFKWKEGKDKKEHVGTTAQYWQNVLPEAVTQGKDGYLTMEYTSLAVASSIALAKKVVEQGSRISELEERLAKLESKLLELL